MHVLIYWVMNVVAFYFFKLGSGHAGWWVPCFIIGNVFGASSIWFSMKLFTCLNPNLAMVLTGVGSFILIQLEMVIIFGSRLELLQWAGIGIGVVGMVLTIVGDKGFISQ